MTFHSSSRRPSSRMTTNPSSTHHPAYNTLRPHVTLSLAPSPQSKSSSIPTNAIPAEGVISGGGGGGGVGAGSSEAMGDNSDPGLDDLTHNKSDKGDGDRHVEHLGGDASGGIDKEMMRDDPHGSGGKSGGMDQGREKEVIAGKKDEGKKEEPRKWVSYDDGKGSGDYGDVSKYHPAWEGFGKGPSVGKSPKAKL